MAAFFCALITVATMVIQIPIGSGGYLNFGDAFVLLSAWSIGPLYGTAAAAVGSALADILSGYVMYAPATFVIKGLVALAAWSVCRILSADVQDSHTSEDSLRKRRNPMIGRLISGTVAEFLMVFGYFLWEMLIFGEGFAALSAVSANALQGVFGVLCGTALAMVVDRLGLIKN